MKILAVSLTAVVVSSLIALTLYLYSKPFYRSYVQYKIDPSKVLLHHKVQKPEFWKEITKDAHKDLAYVRIANEEILDYIYWDNTINGYDGIPNHSSNSDKWINLAMEIESILAKDFVSKLIGNKILGVFILEDIGSSGITYTVTDEYGADKYWIVLDSEHVGGRTLAQWRSNKANSPFKEGWPMINITYDGIPESLNSAAAGILLHEIGHIVEVEAGFGPKWHLPNEYIDPKKHKFMNLSWKKDNYSNKPLYDYYIKNKVWLRFHAKYEWEFTDRSHLIPIYKLLEKTNFNHLYSTVNRSEDFAEYFVEHLIANLGVTKKIEIINKDGTIVKFKQCERSPRCKEKDELLDHWLNQNFAH